MIRISILVVSVLALVGPGAPARASTPVTPVLTIEDGIVTALLPGDGTALGSAACGGLAPYQRSCAANGTLWCCGWILQQRVTVGFTGTLTSRMTNAAMVHSATCDWMLAGVYAPICTAYRTGEPAWGQFYSLTGTTGLAAAGFWEVSVLN